MASISKQANGRRTIQFVGADRKRRSVRLGKVPQKTAEATKVKIEHLVAAAIHKHALVAETARWVAGLGDDLADRLTAVGLIPRRQSDTLASFLGNYIASRIDVKPASRVVWRHVQRNLLDFFDLDRPLRTITAEEAEGFRMYLVSQKLASTTIAKRLQFARQFFRVMLKRKLINENPFAEVKHRAGDTTDRQRFVTREETQ